MLTEHTQREGWNWTERQTGQAGQAGQGRQDRQGRAARAGHAEQGRQGRAGRAGQGRQAEQAGQCTVKEISDNELYLFIKYIKSVLWRVAKRLSLYTARTVPKD